MALKYKNVHKAKGGGCVMFVTLVFSFVMAIFYMLLLPSFSFRVWEQHWVVYASFSLHMVWLSGLSCFVFGV